MFPAKYEFDEKQPDVKAVITKMVQKTQRVMDGHQEEVKKSGKKPYEILTLSSMIEEEAQRPEDRPKISGVFYNRLKKGMKLDSDPTVKYARKSFKVQVLYKELKVDSPYNTYKYKGLPIGPVASPGEEAIIAALNPEQTTYYFFMHVQTDKSSIQKHITSIKESFRNTDMNGRNVQEKLKENMTGCFYDIMFRLSKEA